MDSRLEQLREALKDAKLINAYIYDLNGSSPFFDYVVVASASNKRQLQAAIQHLEEHHLEYDHIEGTNESGWILVDMNNILVNIMSEDARSYYELDNVYIKFEKEVIS